MFKYYKNILYLVNIDDWRVTNVLGILDSACNHIFNWGIDDWRVLPIIHRNRSNSCSHTELSPI
jgi:hypothetical protein